MSQTHPLVTAAVATAAVITATLSYFAIRRYKNLKKRPQLPDTWTRVGTLSDMYIYPVKSCIPVFAEKAETTTLGLRQDWCRDRTLMIVDEKNNFVTSRQQPEMFRIQPTFSGSVLTLRHPEFEECKINLAEVASKSLTATVWGVPVEVLDCGSAAQDFVTKVLDKPCRLVYWPHSTSRELRKTTARSSSKATESDSGAFPDETAYNIVNQASVDDLNKRLTNDRVTNRNFRPSFVVTGPKAYEEDNWKFIKIGDSIFEVLKPCLRCVMTTMDPETGVRSPNNEPVKTLDSYRKIVDPEERKRTGSAPRMGLQIALREGDGNIVSLNDHVYVA